MRTISLAHLTLLSTPPPRLVELAARAGFNAVGLRITPAGRPGDISYPMLAQSPLLRETVRCLADTGLTVLDVEVLRINPTTALDEFKPIFEAAASLGAQHALVWSIDTDQARIMDVFGGLCELAGQHRMRAVLEFSAFSGVTSLSQAARIVDAVNQPNGGVLVDALHLSRSGGSPADIARLDPRRLFYFQLCDAVARMPVDRAGLALESSNRRFPGEGALPNPALVAAFASDTPIAVEAPCSAYAHLPPSEQVARAFEATRAVLAEVPAPDARSGC